MEQQTLSKLRQIFPISLRWTVFLLCLYYIRMEHHQFIFVFFWHVLSLFRFCPLNFDLIWLVDSKRKWFLFMYLKNQLAKPVKSFSSCISIIPFFHPLSSLRISLMQQAWGSIQLPSLLANWHAFLAVILHLHLFVQICLLPRLYYTERNLKRIGHGGRYGTRVRRWKSFNRIDRSQPFHLPIPCPLILKKNTNNQHKKSISSLVDTRQLKGFWKNLVTSTFHSTVNTIS